MDVQGMEDYDINERKATFASRLKVKAVGLIVCLMKKHSITIEDIQSHVKPDKLERLLASRREQAHKVKAREALTKARESRKSKLGV